MFVGHIHNSTFNAFFFAVLCRLENKHLIFWKKKEKKLITAKSRLVGMNGYLEVYNRVKYFLHATSFTPNLRDVFCALIPMSPL